MFTLDRTEYGITTPVSMLYINEIQVEHEEPNLTLTAEQSDDTLELIGFTGTVRFYSGATNYTAPFQGSDFLTGKDGTLYIMITDDLAMGIYDGSLQEKVTLYGVCGWGISGMIQAGNISYAIHDLGIILRVQSLPTDWQTTVLAASQPYAVKTITKPY